MDSSQHAVFEVDGVEIDVATGCLRRNGKALHLRARALQVLVYLIERRDRLVPRDELLSQFWGDTAVTDDAVAQCVADIRRVFGDSSRESRIIKTVPKLGFHFVAPVHERVIDVPLMSPAAAAWGPTDEATAAAVAPTPAAPRVDAPGRSSQLGWFVSIATVLVLIAIALLTADRWWPTSIEPPAAILGATPGKLPVAVMYLENQSRTEDLNWLSEGLADMLIANLSRSGRLEVLSRQELHGLLAKVGHRPGATIDLGSALEVARLSRATTVVLGSFATLGGKVRISVQLHDAGTGRLSAAESLTSDGADRIPGDVDRLALKLAAHMGATMPTTEDEAASRLVMTANLEAYRYYSLAVDKANALLENDAAIELLQKAVALDPQFAMAHARIGYAYGVTGAYPELARPHLERAFRHSERLTEKDRLLLRAWNALVNFDYAGAIEPLSRAIDAFPNEVEAYQRLATVLNGEDRPAEAMEILKRGLSVAPDHREFLVLAGILQAQLGDHAQAEIWLRKALAVAPTEALTYERLAAAQRWAGHYQEALATYQQALTLVPHFGQARLGVGNVYYDLGRYRDALEQYRIVAADSDPTKWVQAHRYSGTVYLRLGDLARAERAAATELKLGPNAAWNSFMVAKARGRRLEAARLREVIEQTEAGPGRGQRTHLRFRAAQRGQLALDEGRVTEALQHFQLLLRSRPVFFDIEPLEDRLANAYLHLGRLDEAVAEYQRVLRLNPNDALSRYHLGLAFERKGNRELAHAELTRFLEIWKDADADLVELKDARARLARLKGPASDATFE